MRWFPNPSPQRHGSCGGLIDYRRVTSADFFDLQLRSEGLHGFAFRGSSGEQQAIALLDKQNQQQAVRQSFFVPVYPQATHLCWCDSGCLELGQGLS